MQELARKFYEAFYSGQFVRDPGFSISSLTIEDAYRIQELVIKMRGTRGERPIGYKVGCTSDAIRNQFGLNEPIVGRLMSPHIYRSHKTFSLDRFFKCAIEPEFVFNIKDNLKGDSLDCDLTRDSIGYAAAGIEVHNLKFWYSPPTSQELIASNGIHACLIIGEDETMPSKLDFKTESFRVFKNEILVAEGKASEIMGDPINSLRFLVSHLSSRGQTLKAGQLVPNVAIAMLHIS